MSNIMEQCMELVNRLSSEIDPGNHIDVLNEYRKWFDNQGINSETEDGWPEEFVFDEGNIKAFVKWYNGGIDGI